jgi:hypothetical protein
MIVLLRQTVSIDWLGSSASLNEFFMNIRLSTPSIVKMIVVFAQDALSLVASSTHHDEVNHDDRIAPSGGVFNYRTGNLDDGTDPIGWYDTD